MFIISSTLPEILCMSKEVTVFLLSKVSHCSQVFVGLKELEHLGMVKLLIIDCTNSNHYPYKDKAIILVKFNSDFYFDWGKTSNTTSADPSTSAIADYKTPNYNSSFTVENMNKDNLGLGYGYHYLPSIGNSKILVIPIQTMDDQFSSNDKNRLQAAFFGKNYQTGWESVASYYEKSSFDQLHITGEVTDAITLNMTTAQLEEKSKKMSP